MDRSIRQRSLPRRSITVVAFAAMTDSAVPPEVIAADHALSRRPQAAPDVEPMTAEQWLAEGREIQARAFAREMEQREKQRAAEGMLRSWAKAHAARDDVIRAASEAGVSAHRIHRITGVARTTISRILAEGSDSD
jgi:hypothetical protein